MRITVQVGVLLALLTAPAGAKVTNWIPLDMSRQAIELPITIKGKPGRALIDSGSNLNVISRSVVDELHIPSHRSRAVSVEGVNTRRSLDAASKVRVGMFGADIVVDDLIVAPIGPDLILGLGFFKKFIVQIDYPNQRMRFLSRGDLNVRKLSNVRTRIGDDGMLQVKLDLNGEKVIWAMLDTGNSGDLLLPRGLVRRMGWLDRFFTEQISAVGVHGVVRELDRFALPKLTVGPFTLSNVPVSVLVKKRGVSDGKTASRLQPSRSSGKVGILGYDVLSHFVVTVDFLGRGLHFAPPEVLSETGEGPGAE